MVVIFTLQNFTRGWISFAFIPALAAHEPWTYFTSIFLHASIEHILVNMAVLLIIGSLLEQSVGARKFISIFLLAGVIGNIGYQITAANQFTPGIGASGAIYGLMGTLAIIDPLQVVYLGFTVPLPIIVLVPVYALLDFLGIFTPDSIAHGAHLGGLVIGLLFGLYMRIAGNLSSPS
jgi:membrane associated rhomboid family serine protease